MKSGIIFSLAAGLAIFVANYAQADEKKPAEQGSLGKALVDRFDTNGNGKIDPDEAEAAKAELNKRGGKGQGFGGKGLGGGKGREALLKKFDANGNGQLDPAEREAAKAAMEKMRGEKGKGKGNAKGKGKGKQARGAGNGAMREALLKRFDANGNGQLEPDEMQAAKAELQKLRGNKIGKK
jgi:hypothetical protein